jgi:hypothetical protein
VYGKKTLKATTPQQQTPQPQTTTNDRKQLDLPVQVFMAPGKDGFRKPEAGMWHFLAARCNGGVAPDPRESFFVGDAAGRAVSADAPGDFADSDKKFAEAAGIDFKTPEEVFGPMDGKRAVDASARSAGLEAVKEGTAVNQGLLDALKAYAAACMDAFKAHGDDKLKWKGIAMNKAVGSLATFGEVITLKNLNAAGKLPGVGKGTLDKVRAVCAGRVFGFAFCGRRGMREVEG